MNSAHTEPAGMTGVYVDLLDTVHSIIRPASIG